MLLRKPSSNEPRSSDITPESVFRAQRMDRRQMLAGVAALGAGALASGCIRR
jgi:hypothetical protein